MDGIVTQFYNYSLSMNFPIYETSLGFEEPHKKLIAINKYKIVGMPVHQYWNTRSFKKCQMYYWQQTYSSIL